MTIHLLCDAASGAVVAQFPEQGVAAFLSTGMSRNCSNPVQRQRLSGSLHQPLGHVHSRLLCWHPYTCPHSEPASGKPR